MSWFGWMTGLSSTVLPWCDEPLTDWQGKPIVDDKKTWLFTLKPGDKFRIHEAPDGTISYCVAGNCSALLVATVIQDAPSMIFGWSSDRDNPYRPWADNGCNRILMETTDFRVEKLETK